MENHRTQQQNDSFSSTKSSFPGSELETTNGTPRQKLTTNSAAKLVPSGIEEYSENKAKAIGKSSSASSTTSELGRDDCREIDEAIEKVKSKLIAKAKRSKQNIICFSIFIYAF